MIWGLPVLQPHTIPPKPLRGLQQGSSWNLSDLPGSIPLFARKCHPSKSSKAFFPPGKLPGCVRKGQKPPKRSQLSVISQEQEQVPLSGFTRLLRGSGMF